MFSVEEGIKNNTKKSYAWLVFSEIALQLVGWVGFVRNDTAIRKLVRAS